MAKFIARDGSVDSKTIDIEDVSEDVPEDVPAKRGRGRPSTGKGKTNAQRQKEWRARRRDEGLRFVTLVLPFQAVDGLKQFTRFKDVAPGEVVSKLIVSQLLRKRSGRR